MDNIFDSSRSGNTITLHGNQLQLTKVVTATEACGKVLSVTRRQDEAVSYGTVSVYTFNTEAGTYKFWEQAEKTIGRRHPILPTIYTEQQRHLIDSETDEHGRSFKITNRYIDWQSIYYCFRQYG